MIFTSLNIVQASSSASAVGHIKMAGPPTTNVSLMVVSFVHGLTSYRDMLAMTG